MRDVDDIANLDRIPINIIQRARCSVWLALVYELFQIYEPENIQVPMLTRLTSYSMQQFSCPCGFQNVFDNETFALTHMRKHPHVHQCLILVRRRKDISEFERLEMPANSYVDNERVSEIKNRLCKLSQIRRRLPPDPIIAEQRR